MAPFRNTVRFVDAQERGARGFEGLFQVFRFKGFGRRENNELAALPDSRQGFTPRFDAKR